MTKYFKPRILNAELLIWFLTHDLTNLQSIVDAQLIHKNNQTVPFLENVNKGHLLCYVNNWLTPPIRVSLTSRHALFLTLLSCYRSKEKVLPTLRLPSHLLPDVGLPTGARTKTIGISLTEQNTLEHWNRVLQLYTFCLQIRTPVREKWFLRLPWWVSASHQPPYFSLIT